VLLIEGDVLTSALVLTLRVTSGGMMTSLSTTKLCMREMALEKALDMSRNLHLIIGYLHGW
jgi:hypothetical protein